jgi:hypothetical protein
MISLLFFLNLFSARAGELIPKLEKSDFFHRCTFQSENHIVIHHFQILNQEKSKCFYAIQVDGKIIVQSTAYAEHCEEFMRKQINKGSVCMSNIDL